MKYFKWAFILSFILGISSLTYYFFWIPSDLETDEFYTVEQPVRKEIKQVISTTGTLKLKDQIKVGSLVTGRIKSIHVAENDLVKEGQLLAEIDTGLGDTEVREAEGSYEGALAELEYQTSHYQRQKQLFEEHFISEVALQEAKRDYLTTLANVKSLKAQYDKTLISFQQLQIHAPAAGIIIYIEATKGDLIKSDGDDGTILWLAPDVKQIEVELEINEKDIGQIQKGQQVQMVVDTYPHRTFESKIENVSFMAKVQNDNCTYLAKAYIDNPQLLLRPGMNVNAKIDVAAVDSTWALTSRPFLIKQEHLQPVAQFLNYTIEPVDNQTKQALLLTHADQNIQFVWQICEQCFREIPIELGTTDNIYFEIKSDLQGDEKLIVDVMEDDQMKKIYEKIFRKL